MIEIFFFYHNKEFNNNKRPGFVYFLTTNTRVMVRFYFRIFTIYTKDNKK